MPHVLIIGASRGIGQQFVKHYLADGATVSATARDSGALQTLVQAGAHSISLDVLDPAAPEQLQAALAAHSIDLAIINAGVFGPRADAPDAPSQADFDFVMRTNVWGPMRLLEPVSSRLRDGGKLALISSRMGSVGARTSAQGWLYRASKSALNSVAKDAALTLAGRGINCVVFHPGWVRTDMGGANADIDVAESVSGMAGVLAQLTHSGQFINYDGTHIPW